jgi:hypothetical protein
MYANFWDTSPPQVQAKMRAVAEALTAAIKATGCNHCRLLPTAQFQGEPGPDVIAFNHGSAWRVWPLETARPRLADELAAWYREVHARMPSDEGWFEMLKEH